MVSKDKVLSLLRDINDRFPTNLPKGGPDYASFWTNKSWNMGDTLLLSVVPPKASKALREVYVYNYSVYFQPLMLFNDYYKVPPAIDLAFYNDLFYLKAYDYGPGHWLQFQCRGMGFEADIRPKPYLNIHCDPKPNKVLINVEGISFDYLTNEIINVIQEFVDRNRNRYHFVETFSKQETPYLKNVEWFRVSFIEMVARMTSFDYFIGLDSGLMHLAAAMDIKSVIITDGPKIENFYLPKPNSNYTDLVHMDYPYPQNVHLHPKGENELVKKLTVENLERAIDGNLYPYWREDYLDLILDF